MGYIRIYRIRSLGLFALPYNYRHLKSSHIELHLNDNFLTNLSVLSESRTGLYSIEMTNALPVITATQASTDSVTVFYECVVSETVY
jgi:hypothetical protein